MLQTDLQPSFPLAKVKTETVDHLHEPLLLPNVTVKREPVSTGEEEWLCKREMIEEDSLSRNGSNSVARQAMKREDIYVADDAPTVKSEVLEMDTCVLLADYNRDMKYYPDHSEFSVKGRQLPEFDTDRSLGTGPSAGCGVDQVLYNDNRRTRGVKRTLTGETSSLLWSAESVNSSKRYRMTVATSGGPSEKSDTLSVCESNIDVSRSDYAQIQTPSVTTEEFFRKSKIYGEPFATNDHVPDSVTSTASALAKDVILQNNRSLKREKLKECNDGNYFLGQRREKTKTDHLVDETSYCCDICGKRCTDRWLLKRHMAVHTGVKPFTCDVCPKRFTHRCFLKTHMLTHTGEKRHTCGICHKGFVHRSSFKTHMLIHSGEKPHTCEICHKSFTQRGDIKTHMLVHTGEKPYTCDICNKGFTQRGSLTTHMLTHTGVKPYTCEICQKSFTRRYGLKTHMSIHTLDKPYTCDICDKGFRYRSCLNRHMRTHAS